MEVWFDWMKVPEEEECTGHSEVLELKLKIVYQYLNVTWEGGDVEDMNMNDEDDEQAKRGEVTMIMWMYLYETKIE